MRPRKRGRHHLRCRARNPELMGLHDPLRTSGVVCAPLNLISVPTKMSLPPMVASAAGTPRAPHTVSCDAASGVASRQIAHTVQILADASIPAGITRPGPSSRCAPFDGGVAETSGNHTEAAVELSPRGRPVQCGCYRRGRCDSRFHDAFPAPCAPSYRAQPTRDLYRRPHQVRS